MKLVSAEIVSNLNFEKYLKQKKHAPQSWRTESVLATLISIGLFSYAYYIINNRGF